MDNIKKAGINLGSQISGKLQNAELEQKIAQTGLKKNILDTNKPSDSRAERNEINKLPDDYEFTYYSFTGKIQKDQSHLGRHFDVIT